MGTVILLRPGAHRNMSRGMMSAIQHSFREAKLSGSIQYHIQLPEKSRIRWLDADSNTILEQDINFADEKYVMQVVDNDRAKHVTKFDFVRPEKLQSTRLAEFTKAKYLPLTEEYRIYRQSTASKAASHSRFTGGCFDEVCNNPFRFKLKPQARPWGIFVCHCLICRRSSNTGKMWVAVHETDIIKLSGNLREGKRVVDDVARMRCESCEELICLIPSRERTFYFDALFIQDSKIPNFSLTTLPELERLPNLEVAHRFTSVVCQRIMPWILLCVNSTSSGLGNFISLLAILSLMMEGKKPWMH